MARTGPLLFARVTKEVFYAIDIYTHDDFADAEIVEVIHRNWPKSIEHWILRGIQTGGLTPDQREVLRKKRYNSFVQVTDGTTYAPIGGGYFFPGIAFMRSPRWTKSTIFWKTWNNWSLI